MREPIEPPMGDLDRVDLLHPDVQRSVPRDASNRPRKPWLAFVLAIVCWPAAFAYVGRYAWCVQITALLVETV